MDRLPARRATRRTRNQSGAVAVEFALIMPILFMIVFGIIEFGFMINRDMIVGNASRDGAREASLNGSFAEICTTAKNSLTQAGIPVPALCNDAAASPTRITIDCKKPDDSPCYATSANYDTLAEPGSTAIVTVRYVHSWITPGLAFLGNSVTLQQVTQMRVE